MYGSTPTCRGLNVTEGVTEIRPLVTFDVLSKKLILPLIHRHKQGAWGLIPDTLLW